MDTLPHEAQLALISFLIALGIGGPIALIGAGNAFALARWAGAFAFRRRMATGFLVSLLGGAGLLGSGLLGSGTELVAGLVSGLFA
ncbi:hypothetical protein [Maricaulis sp.]|uniref:hypothetical protein n=1 Tax=Maricaulis sp. TaxID=1486257 RepID=UPI0025C02D67|nr:hypothetical protein [Maricaulis sp.]